jgi:hypothetical protein
MAEDFDKKAAMMMAVVIWGVVLVLGFGGALFMVS